MPTLAGPVRFRTLITPKDYPPFIDFCCGKDRLEEHEVNRTVRRLCAGATEVQQISVILERATAQDANGHPPLVGVCSVATGVLQGVQGIVGAEGAYIPAIGTDLAYRKHVLDGSRIRPGNALLTGALKTIETMFGGDLMPYVFAKVKPPNRGSKTLFDEHGFEDMGNQGGEHILLRPPGVAPTLKRRPTWSKDQ
jgi:hypothetical protein